MEENIHLPNDGENTAEMSSPKSPRKTGIQRRRPRKSTTTTSPVEMQSSEAIAEAKESAPMKVAESEGEWMHLSEMGPIHEPVQPSVQSRPDQAALVFSTAEENEPIASENEDATARPRAHERPESRGNEHRQRPNRRNFHKQHHGNRPEGSSSGHGHPNANRSWKGGNGNNRNNNHPSNPRQPTGGVVWGELGHWDTLSNEEALNCLVEQASGGGEPKNLNYWYGLPLAELLEEAKQLDVVLERNLSRTSLLRECMRTAFQKRIPVHATGVLHLLNNGNGFIVYAHDNYLLREQSTFVSRYFIQRYELKRGHTIRVQLHPPRLGETCPCAIKVLDVAGESPEKVSSWVPFVELTPYYPLERIFLEVHENNTSWDNISMRIVDLLTPIGFGQRGLIVAPPRTGKTMLLQSIAHAVRVNKPDAHLIILLVDERPEEVTDFKRQIASPAEVISSTFDAPAEQHVRVAEMALEKARCLVEAGKHVIILLDSITRLARAYNALQPSSGKILSGGVEANALQEPKRFFGSARNIEGGGSLTILATALIETGSKMDEVIFEEFKGTGNMELHLDRALVDKRIFPAINLEKSGTRKEELLYHPEEIQKVYALRRAIKGVPSTEAMEMLIQRVKKTKNNIEFLMNVAR